MSNGLKNKVAIVTGGSRGIGAAIVQQLAAEGANVVLTYASSAEAAERQAAAARDKGVEAEAIKADAADGQAVRDLVARVVERFGGLDILVNNAGIFAGGPLEETSDEDFERTVDINIRAVFLAAREAAKVMTSGGRIINIGSIFGQRAPLPGLGLYAMSKFAVAGLTRAWARDLGAKGITVNCVQPGPIDTEMNPAECDLATAMTPLTALGRYGRAEEIAVTVAFLASPAASNLTGAMINVDGGFEA